LNTVAKSKKRARLVKEEGEEKPRSVSNTTAKHTNTASSQPGNRKKKNHHFEASGVLSNFETDLLNR
jgi:hypothetical protein